MNPASMNGHTPKAAVLDKPRARRDAAKVLAIALQTRYRKLLEASGEDEIVVATTDLAQCMYENVEFVIWSLKSQGGMNPPPPEQLHKVMPPSVLPIPAESMKKALNATAKRFAKPPEVNFEEPVAYELPCICPPLEAGIIGRDKHMTSCPKYVP